MLTGLIYYVVSFYFIGICYNILIRQGELLMHWARFVNLTFESDMLKKLLLCPYCLTGQLLLWTLVIRGELKEYFISIPILIVAIYYTLNKEN